MRFSNKEKKKKRERRNDAVLRQHCFFFFFPRTCSRGGDVFVFFSLSLPLLPTCSATHLMMRCPSSRAPQATPPLATTAGVVAEVATCATCTRRWDEAGSTPPAPINTNRTQGKKKRKERQKTGRETDSVEREGTETVETKNRGYRQRDRERQTEKRKKKGQKE
jgi:hypothetical protein